MWLLVVCRASDYWLGTLQRVTLIVIVENEVWLVTPSRGTRCVPRGSRGLILGSTGRGTPVCIPSVFSQHTLSDCSASELVLISMENVLCVGRLVLHFDDAR